MRCFCLGNVILAVVQCGGKGGTCKAEERGGQVKHNHEASNQLHWPTHWRQELMGSAQRLHHLMSEDLIIHVLKIEITSSEDELVRGYFLNRF